MRVRIKDLGMYDIDTKIGDIIEAIDFDGYYKCLCNYSGKKGWLFFGTNQVEVIEPQTDQIVESVINQFKQRSEIGIAKYGTTLERKDLSTLEWIEHAKQEAMDFILYLERLKQEML
jgi:hypothetical protein